MFEKISLPEPEYMVHQKLVDAYIAENFPNFKTNWLVISDSELTFTIQGIDGLKIYNKEQALLDVSTTLLGDLLISENYIADTINSVFENPPVIRLQKIEI